MLGEYVSRDRYVELTARAGRQSQPLLEFDAATLQACYNRAPFLLNHHLDAHPQFELGPLLALCRRLPPAQVQYRVGLVPEDTHFDSSLSRYRQGLTLDDAIDRLEECKAYIAIYNPERDPAYRPVIEALLGEIALNVDPLEPGINWYSTYVFVSAQHSVTPYHMDREMNFLLQVRGTKTAQLWDPRDDEVMSQAQKDFLFSGSSDARPTYRAELAAKAMSFELRPGLGVHHPFIAPHIVRTGPALSVSLAFTFRTARSDLLSDAHRFNQRLRAWGLRPGPVGSTPRNDRFKANLVRALRRAKQVLRRAPAAS